jgi:hypothetical protein
LQDIELQVLGLEEKLFPEQEMQNPNHRQTLNRQIFEKYCIEDEAVN